MPFVLGSSVDPAAELRWAGRKGENLAFATWSYLRGMEAGVYEPLPGVVGWCRRQVSPDLVGVGIQANVQHAGLGGLREGQ